MGRTGRFAGYIPLIDEEGHPELGGRTRPAPAHTTDARTRPPPALIKEESWVARGDLSDTSP
ncbi:hypothetical protein [Polymorphospora rubra]|uniref:Uncharacterized protein n=1 Tax=Polymorphospora rubra TaxID=338584 RepID=A0A810N7X1_9ACTN|nr:hypothetical protein [Polymorphospora rubra]BCJ69911.1 hypothetical protein Prubr_69320 [Polymorphospora rubra]